MTTSDQKDLLIEQVKMLAGDIAFSTSTLKRLMEQSVHDPECSKIQVFCLAFKRHTEICWRKCNKKLLISNFLPNLFIFLNGDVSKYMFVVPIMSIKFV